MEVKGKLNKISNGQYGVGILVAGFDGFINTKDNADAIGVKEGDFVKLQVQRVEKNGKVYHNFKAADLVKAEGSAPANTATPSKSSSYQGGKSSYDSEAPVRGMAFNNAIQVAIALNKTTDAEFIKKTTVELYNLVKEVEQELTAGKKSKPVVASLVDEDDDDLDSVFAKAV